MIVVVCSFTGQKVVFPAGWSALTESTERTRLQDQTRMRYARWDTARYASTIPSSPSVHELQWILVQNHVQKTSKFGLISPTTKWAHWLLATDALAQTIRIDGYNKLSTRMYQSSKMCQAPWSAEAREHGHKDDTFECERGRNWSPKKSSNHPQMITVF